MTEAQGPGGQLWAFDSLVFVGEVEEERRGYWWHWGWNCPLAAGRALQGTGHCSYGSPGICLCPPSPASRKNPESSPYSHASRGHRWPAGGDKRCVVIRAKPTSWPWRSPQPPPTMALSGCNLCGASSEVLGRPGSCKCHLVPLPPMAP